MTVIFFSGYALAAPTNPCDNFGSGCVISTADLEMPSLTNSSNEPGEPNPQTKGVALHPYETTSWYTWTAPTTGKLNISFTAIDTSQNQVVTCAQEYGAFYIGSSLSTLYAVPNNSKVIAGQSYKIQIYRETVRSNYDSQYCAGNTTVHLNITSNRPANDDFENAAIISGQSSSITQNVDITNGTFQLYEPSPFYDEPSWQVMYPANASLWYEWTAPYTGVASFSTASLKKQYLTVYTGTQVNNLTSVAQGVSLLRQTDNNGNPIGDYKQNVRFDVVAGATYKIAVNVLDALGSNPFTLSWAKGTPVDISVFTTAPVGAVTGTNVTYQATINTTGNAENVIFKTTIPSGFSIINPIPSECVIGASQVITCTIPFLSQTKTLIFTLQVLGSGSYNIASTVTKNGSDLDASNNANTAPIVTGTEVADLSPVVTSPIDINAVNTPSFDTTVVIKDLGPTVARNTVLTYDLHGVTPVSIPSGCSTGTGSMVCQLGTVSGNTSFTVKLKAVLPITTGHIYSTVTVSSSTPDPISTNNNAVLISSLSITSATQVPIDSWWVLTLLASLLAALSVWKYRKVA